MMKVPDEQLVCQAGQRIVLAQPLDVADLEAGLLQHRDVGGQRLQLAVREDDGPSSRA